MKTHQQIIAERDRRDAIDAHRQRAMLAQADINAGIIVLDETGQIRLADGVNKAFADEVAAHPRRWVSDSEIMQINSMYPPLQGDEG